MAENGIVIRSMWHGAPLSIYEHLSLKSFVKLGHRVELYAYTSLDVPPGVQLRDANEVLPKSEIFTYTSGFAKGSFAAFSNLFRFKLLYERGGAWLDLDMLCLRELESLPENWLGRINHAAMKFSPGHPITKSLYEALERLGPELQLGQTARLFKSALADYPGLCEVLPARAFFPVQWPQASMLVDPDERERCEARVATSYCVHWWNGVLAMGIGIPKSALPPRGSFLYERATAVFGHSNLPTWPPTLVDTWVRNYKGVGKTKEFAEVVEKHAAELAEVRRREKSWARMARNIERSRSWRLGSRLIRILRLLTFRPTPSRGPAELAASIEEQLTSGGVGPSDNTGPRPVQTSGYQRRGWTSARAAGLIERLRSRRRGRLSMRLTRLRTNGLALLKPPLARSQGKSTQDEGDDADPHELDSRAAWNSLAGDRESPYLYSERTAHRLLEDSGFLSIYHGFCGRLPRSASVLDLGCGPGVPFAQDLVDRGFQVTGVDFSTAMIEAARRNCPSARFICMSMTDIAFESTFDAVIAISSMLCLRPDEFRATAVAISNALKPHGQLLLTLNEPKGPVDRTPASDATAYSISRRTVYARAYTEDEVRQAFSGLRMKIESVDRQVVESQLYGREHVIAFVMTKNSSPRDRAVKGTESDPLTETPQQLEPRDEVLKEQDRFLQWHGYPLNLVSPRSFNEKICWRKLFDRNPLFPVVADKYRVREFVEVMLGPEDAKRYLVPLLFEARDPAAIPFEQLPSEYVIKVNHGYRMNFIIREGCEVSNEEIVDRCREWMNSEFSLRHNEWAYSQIDRRIIGEELVAGKEGRPPRDVKLHMFDGKCELIQVVASDAWYDGHTIGADNRVTQTFYTPDWQEVKPMHGRVSAPDDEPPDELEEITDLARRLSTPFDYIRVDVYLAGGDIRFGELTMYPDAGKGRFATAELDFEMGRLWRLPRGGTSE